ncbi:MAG: ferredoxin [Flavobacteriales bacterium]|nr:ferredoxin [Flavobacteriales bacterium]
MPQIIFYREKCIGCNACVEAAPEQWRMSRKDGRCNLIGSSEKKGIYRSKIQEEDLPANRIAERNCPVNIIKVSP